MDTEIVSEIITGQDSFEDILTALKADLLPIDGWRYAAALLGQSQRWAGIMFEIQERDRFDVDPKLAKLIG